MYIEVSVTLVVHGNIAPFGIKPLKFCASSIHYLAPQVLALIHQNGTMVR